MDEQKRTKEAELERKIDRAWTARIRWGIYRWTALIALVLIVSSVVTYMTTGHSEEISVESTSLAADNVIAYTEFEPPVVHEEDVPVYYTDEDVEVLAKTLWGEARGIESDTERAAVVWCVLNRVDDQSGLFPDTITEVATAPYQFDGYSPDNPVDSHLEWVVRDVLRRWVWEKEDKEIGGRVLPEDYLYFLGDKVHNYFTVEWQGTDTWDWSLESPYPT